MIFRLSRAHDSHVNGFLRALRLEEEELGYHNARSVVSHRTHQADNPVLEQSEFLANISVLGYFRSSPSASQVAFQDDLEP